MVRSRERVASSELHVQRFGFGFAIQFLGRLIRMGAEKVIDGETTICGQVLNLSQVQSWQPRIS